MDNRIFQGLNAGQAEAVRAVRGPVCILAGAGTGKTTTITRRIANQIATGTFAADEILAVTFTEKAAKEMGERLRRLGAPAVRARTFHAEALAQYKKFSLDTSEIVPSKGQLLAPLAQRLPMPHKFTAVRDLATEIEWAKNRCIDPDRYASEIERSGHQPPIPVELMAGLYASYERKKERMQLIDFEDLLQRTVRLLANDPRLLGVIRSRYRAFTVDEYQDVNLLQQSLLDAWVGEREELCVVGDDYQSIFGFTGATPAYLLDFPRRYPSATVVRLTSNYRSTPEVLEVANRLVPKLGGQPKSLHAARAGGPAAIFREHATGREEISWIVAQCRALHENGTPWEHVAVLLRINGRSEDLEEAFGKDRIPYQVRDGAFLRRAAAKAMLARLRRPADGSVAQVVAAVAAALGLREAADDLEPEEATRQADLARLVTLAREYESAHNGGEVAGFIADLQRRFASEAEGRGINILTYHRSKGLEFDAVFLPRLEEKELPFAFAKSDEDVAEERRLLYVGITRAKTSLFVSWAVERSGDRRRNPRPSRFLNEIRAERSFTTPKPEQPKLRVKEDALGLFTALKQWRLEAARFHAVPAYVVFHDETLARIAEERPRSVIALGRVSGVGPAKIAKYGSDVLELVQRHAV